MIAYPIIESGRKASMTGPRIRYRSETKAAMTKVVTRVSFLWYYPRTANIPVRKAATA